MFIKIIINDLKKSSIFSNTILNVIIKIFLCLGVFCGVYNLSKVLKNTMQLNKFITLILCVNIILIYLINLIIHKIIIQKIKQDSIITFLKKERFNYIKGRIDLFIIKLLIYFIVPSIMPIFMIHENPIMLIILFILIIASYYFLNGILIFGINYISFRAKSSPYIKILYLLISIILLTAFIFIASYMTFLMLSIVLKQHMVAINFKLSFNYMLLLAIIVCGLLMVLYIFICNFINKNLYIFFYDIQAQYKCESEVGNKLINSRYFKNKILIKDLIEFYRRKSMLKIIGFIVQGLAFGFMCYIYLEDQTNIYNFINSIPIINLIILFQIIPIILIYTLISYQDIKVKDELSSLKQFSIKVNIKYIIIGKSNYLFSISIAPLLIGMTILFFRNISIRFFIEMIYIILPITFFGKFLSIFTIKFILMKEKLKEFKLIILFIVIVFNTAILIFTMNPDNTIILKNVYNIIFIFFNIILYYTEVLGLIIFRKWWESAEN